jgi:hypothetical protein
VLEQILRKSDPHAGKARQALLLPEYGSPVRLKALEPRRCIRQKFGQQIPSITGPEVIGAPGITDALVVQFNAQPPRVLPRR